MLPLVLRERGNATPLDPGRISPGPAAIEAPSGWILSSGITDLPSWVTLTGVIFGFQSISIGLTVGVVLIYSDITGDPRVLPRLALGLVTYLTLTAAAVLSLEVLVRASAFVLVAVVTISVTVALVITWRLATVPMGHK